MPKILLATDGSPSARNATSYAVELAAATGWTLSVVSVWCMATTYVAEVPAASLERIRRKQREHAERVVDEAVEEARVRGVDAEGETVYGDPVTDIAAAAEGAALLVVGSHGWGTVKRVVFGSVSYALLHAAPCPVLVVRADLPVALEEPVALATG